MTDAVVRVEGVSKKFCRSLRRSLWYGLRDLSAELLGRAHANQGTLRRDEFWAVKDVSFELKRGECLGLIGHNGAGKTTLLKMLNGLIKPDVGRIEMRGRVGALIALGAGFHPLLSGRENIFVNASILGFTRQETTRRFDEIVEFSGLTEHIDSPIQHYSSGMLVRLGFAIAAHLEPDVLLVDEALAVGDAAFTVKCLNRIATLRNKGTSVVFVSHSERQVREAASRCILLSRARLAYDGSVDKGFAVYESTRPEAYSDSDAGFVLDGPVRLEGCAIDSIPPLTDVRTGGAVRIAVNCHSMMPIHGARFLLRFWNANGQVVTSIDSVAQGQAFDLPQGRSTISVTLPAIPFVPGRYRIAGGFKRDGEVLGWTRDLAYLDVGAPAEICVSEGYFITPAIITSTPS